MLNSNFYVSTAGISIVYLTYCGERPFLHGYGRLLTLFILYCNIFCLIILFNHNHLMSIFVPCSLILFVGVEICWNIYPSNAYSSALLLCLHLVILWGLWSAPSEYPCVNHKSYKEKRKEK